MKNTNSILTKLSVLLFAFIAAGDYLISPNRAAMLEEFADASSFAQSFLVSGSSLMAIPGSLICGKLANYVSKKNIAVFSCLLVGIAGTLSAIVSGIGAFILMRCLTGLGVGFSGAVTYAMIAELYTEEKVCASMMAWYTSVLTVLGILIATLGGYLGLYNWHYAFLIYAGSFVVAILGLLFVPGVPPVRSLQSGIIKEKPKTPFPYKKVITVCIAGMVAYALIFVYNYYKGVYVIEEGIGTSLTAGFMSSCGSVGSFLVGLIFSLFYRKVRAFVPACVFGLLVLICGVLTLNINVVILLCVGFCGGVLLNTCVSQYFMKVTTIVPQEHVTMASGLMNSFLYMGMFFSPYIKDGLSAIFGLDSIKSVFLYIAVLGLICCIISLVLALRNRKKTPPETTFE
ncbi:MAG: MFS transporter [Bacillota bacterium]|nr:MFS transporter [Bacillota bacterium]